MNFVKEMLARKEEMAKASSNEDLVNGKGKEILAGQVSTNSMDRSVKRKRLEAQLLSSQDNIVPRDELNRIRMARLSSEEHPLDSKRLRGPENTMISRNLNQLGIEEEYNKLSVPYLQKEVERLPVVMDYYSDMRLQLERENEELMRELLMKKLELTHNEVKEKNLKALIQTLKKEKPKWEILHQQQQVEGNIADGIFFTKF